MKALKRIITALPSNSNNIYPSYTESTKFDYHQIHQPTNAFLPHFQTSFLPYAYPSTFPAALNNPVTSTLKEERISFEVIITYYFLFFYFYRVCLK